MTKERESSQQSTNPDLLGSESLEQGLFVDLVRAASRLEASLNRSFRPYELTTATYTILVILEKSGREGQSCGDIASQLIADVPDMTRLLDRLEKLEYVVRERSAMDRRMVKVRITHKGLEVVHVLKETVLDCHRRQFAKLSTDQITTLRTLLRVVGGPESDNLQAPYETRPKNAAGV